MEGPPRIAYKQRCGLSITRTVRELQPLRRLHILFVDSDPGGRDRIQQALLGDGFVVQCVASASDARRSLEAHLPDILICEVLLGSESGLDFCRSVRNTPEFQHMPIMLLTSLATFQDKVVGFHAGADDYVVKPFDTRHLMARIRLLSRIKRLEQHDNK
ncbi:MAG: response regulator transcription factor [Ktedonobacteraceae bacterium]